MNDSSITELVEQTAKTVIESCLVDKPREVQEKAMEEFLSFKLQEGKYSRMGNRNFTPLQFWKAQHHSSPLAQVAKAVFAIPASSASVERSFSVQARIRTKERNRLTFTRVKKLMQIRMTHAMFSSIENDNKITLPSLCERKEGTSLDALSDEGEGEDEEEEREFRDIIDVDTSDDEEEGIQEAEVVADPDIHDAIANANDEEFESSPCN